MDILSQEDFRRLESKVDKLTDAVQRLIIVEERQSNMVERIGQCEIKLQSNETLIYRVDSKVERWVNRGVGVWALVIVLFAALQLGAKLASN